MGTKIPAKRAKKSARRKNSEPRQGGLTALEWLEEIHAALLEGNSTLRHIETALEKLEATTEARLERIEQALEPEEGE